MEKQVTPLAAMREQARGRIVEIPGWVPGATINVRVRQVDLTAHVLKTGLVGNPLLEKAREAFEGKAAVAADAPSLEAMEALLPMFDAVAKEALVEPAYDQAVTEVAPLTFDQKMAIFDAATSGLSALRSFRGQTARHGTPGAGRKNLGGKAK